jgi:hypothetical protein
MFDFAPSPVHSCEPSGSYRTFEGDQFPVACVAERRIKVFYQIGKRDANP